MRLLRRSRASECVPSYVAGLQPVAANDEGETHKDSKPLQLQGFFFCENSPVLEPAENSHYELS